MKSICDKFLFFIIGKYKGKRALYEKQICLLYVRIWVTNKGIFRNKEYLNRMPKSYSIVNNINTVYCEEPLIFIMYSYPMAMKII